MTDSAVLSATTYRLPSVTGATAAISVVAVVTETRLHRQRAIAQLVGTRS